MFWEFFFIGFKIGTMHTGNILYSATHYFWLTKSKLHMIHYEGCSERSPEYLQNIEVLSHRQHITNQVYLACQPPIAPRAIEDKVRIYRAIIFYVLLFASDLVLK